PFRNCSSSCTEKTTVFNNGHGGGSGTHPGNSNWTSGQGTQGSWETWIGSRGDIARAQLYLDVRYEGGSHGSTGHSEPDLILVDDESLIATSSTGSNEAVAYMGMLEVLIQWHHEDPVDDFERRRNDVVYSYQGNRNPFVDHPEWVDCLFGGDCESSGFQSFCFGDGSGTACPCGNDGASGGGCGNSTGAGAVLSSTGSGSITSADLVLSVAGLPPGPGLYFQGNNAVNSGDGNPFGDGLRCVGGQVVRIEVRFSSSGSSGTTGPIAEQGGVSAGDLKRYQLWYRDTNGSPCESGFNLSNGYEVIWTP
ncbi:MAG: endonuclease, partial [Planctomycetes bacterium]|nr:endonuclease [Planctomycetota bacterium]